jgi:alpha-D-ribose 1-methylphosphonate 5-triphosphate diphosphatase PhnM
LASSVSPGIRFRVFFIDKSKLNFRFNHRTSESGAKLYKLSDRGELKTGTRADLILFTLEDYTMNIKKTIVAGKTVHEASK